MKKILRGPIIYILLAIVAVWIGSSLITSSGFREVSTQEGLQLLEDDKVSSVKIVDGENRVDLTLTEAEEEHWLTRFAVPVLVNRYNGTLVRGE